MSDCYGWSRLLYDRPNNGANVILAFKGKAGSWFYKCINGWQFEHNLHYRDSSGRIWWKYIGHAPNVCSRGWVENGKE